MVEDETYFVFQNELIQTFRVNFAFLNTVYKARFRLETLIDRGSFVFGNLIHNKEFNRSGAVVLGDGNHFQYFVRCYLARV